MSIKNKRTESRDNKPLENGAKAMTSIEVLLCVILVFLVFRIVRAEVNHTAIMRRLDAMRDGDK